ncbi:X-ray repair cross-complementing protein 5 [Phlyctochytrium planicorne]|nr:X-ray repair cross-complementing protein 5 [Phlyctochytrium planicorne]
MEENSPQSVAFEQQTMHFAATPSDAMVKLKSISVRPSPKPSSVDMSGDIWIKNIAFEKAVTVHVSSPYGQFSKDSLKGKYVESRDGGYEIWGFDGTVENVGFGSKLYVRYQAQGTIFYDNNGGEGQALQFIKCVLTKSFRINYSLPIRRNPPENLYKPDEFLADALDSAYVSSGESPIDVEHIPSVATLKDGIKSLSEGEGKRKYNAAVAEEEEEKTEAQLKAKAVTDKNKGKKAKLPKKNSFWQTVLIVVGAFIIGGRKTDLISLVLLGSNETENPLDGQGYRNIKVQYGVQMANLEMLKYVTSECDKGQEAGDILDGIVVGITVLEGFCKHLKYEKTIFIFTDAENEINPDGIEEIQNKATDYEVKVNVIGFGFTEDGPPDYDTSTKAQNERLLRNFSSATGGEVFQGEEALALLSNLRSKSVRPVTLIRNAMTLGDIEDDNHLSMQVWAYAKVNEAKLPSAKKWSKVAIEAADRDESTFGEVKMDRTYKLVQQQLEDDEMGAMRVAEEVEIDKDDLVKAYKYGKDLVPFAEEDQEAMKLHTSKGFSILGFVKSSDIPREYLLNNPMQVIPDPGHPRSKTIFESLALALKFRSKYALVRYVRIDNAAPKLGVLMPHIGKKIWCAWIQIPYKEDIREYAFPSLTPLLENVTPNAIGTSTLGSTLVSNGSQARSTQQSNGGASIPRTIPASQTQPSRNEAGSQEDPSQTLVQSSQTLAASVIKGPIDRIIAPAKKKALANMRITTSEEADRRIDELIESMDLMKAIEEDGEYLEAFKATDLFNPAYQRIYQCMAYRALNPDDTELPPLDPRFVASVLPLPDLVEKAKPAIEAVKEAFKIEKVDTGKESNKEKFRNQLDNAEAVAERLGLNGEENAMDIEDMNLTRLTETLVNSVGTQDPVSDFKAMLARRDVDLVSTAVQQMADVITNIVKKSFGTQLFPKAFQCITALREGCMLHSEVSTYNDWLAKFKDDLVENHASFWEEFSGSYKNLGPITLTEKEESSVSEAEAGEFFIKGERPAAAVDEPMEDAEEDDMLGMLD